MNIPHIIIEGSDGQKVTVFGAVPSDVRIGVSATDAPVFLSRSQAVALVDALSTCLDQFACDCPMHQGVDMEGQIVHAL